MKIQKYGGVWWLYNPLNENEKYSFSSKKELLNYCKKYKINVEVK